MGFFVLLDVLGHAGVPFCVSLSPPFLGLICASTAIRCPFAGHGPIRLQHRQRMQEPWTGSILALPAPSGDAGTTRRHLRPAT